MSVAIVTGSAGLIGSETTRFLTHQGLEVAGIDNDMRSVFFGADASTAWNRRRLEAELSSYRHFEVDIRDGETIDRIFERYGRSVSAVVHTAAQPSHDWAARDPRADFTTNANGTLEVLEATRRHCPEAAFIFTSTNKVYGDRPNDLPLLEIGSRWELDPAHPFAADGIDETMSIDSSLHSIFGASKIAADLMVQEYGRYFGMKTACFRGGCLTGPNHSGTHLHGFLAYLARCAVTGTPYVVHGYKGKQVRDNIHSYDLVNAFWAFIRRPRSAEVYNIGGSRHSNCSILEAIELSERLLGHPMNWRYEPQPRVGDHIWWISDVRKFKSHYPDWNYRYDLRTTLEEIIESIRSRFPFEEDAMPIEVCSLAEWQSAGVKDMLSVVIPAHNEEGHLEGTVKNIIEELAAAQIRFEILVVNDNSRDNTERVLVKLCAVHPEVRYISNMPPNRYGFAVRSGLAEFRGDAVAVFMADGSDDASDLVRFYRKFQEGYDCVFGSRFIRGGSTIHYPLHKLILNRIGNLLIQALFLLRYNDVTNAFKLYSRTAIAGIQPLLSSEFNLTVEMPLKCIVRGYRYAVMSNSWRNRKEGISKFKIREMGSRYLFIILYCLLEKILAGGDHEPADRALQLQVWPR